MEYENSDSEKDGPNRLEADQAIYELLAMTIFADKKICSDEINAFVDSIEDLQAKNILSSEFSERQIILWYEMHKLPLQAKMKAAGFEPWLEATLSKIKHIPYMPEILEAIETIARADHEVHISEKAFQVLAAG